MGMVEFPAAWVQATLMDLVAVQYGKALSANERVRAGRVPVVGSSGIVDTHDVELVNGASVIVGRKGAAGAVHLLQQPSWPIDTAYYLQPPDGLDIRWLYHYLGTQNLGELDKSTAIPSLSRDDLYKVQVPLAPTAEQITVVEKLEELLSDLDAGVAELKAAQQKLARYRQSLLKAAVQGELTAAWREQHPPTETGAQLLERILVERRTRWEARQLAKFEQQGKARPKDWQKKYPEPVWPDTADLPALPQGWVWASAEQLCEFITKGTTPPKDVDDGSRPEVPFLRVTNLTDRGVLDMQDQVFVSSATHRGFLARSVVYPGDVLMNIVGPPLGQAAIVPGTWPEWNINQAIAIYRAVDGVAASFVCSYLLSSVAQRWLKSRAKTTAGQTNLTLELCRNLPIPLPPTGEQAVIGRVLEAAVSAVADQAKTADLALPQSTAQRQNILRSAFNGQLVPQDPADEPASALLARIRAERAAQGAIKKPRGRKAREAV